ncbi:subunit beta of glucosidase II [Chloropicon primus]|uniref:Subunit beta of glucosidase II n=2 Tax=Chloropicon primus TaxID=1764295 RepID=A0A5B8MKI4_9CHLO|nr:subunit beta of glucosidase II [Chloropicon primus]UPQ99785.1 subunit beta of glucosidase II [Chloropicon primus]|eukprot:QDZ20574.1 subunit beta of glucosidase II [Chloropicon primus]
MFSYHRKLFSGGRLRGPEDFDPSLLSSSSILGGGRDRDRGGGAADVLRGVSPSTRKAYEAALRGGEGSSPSFACFDGSKVLAPGALNDNYCDCEDGSDEPGTSACANGRFYCQNARSKPKTISSMFVDDGVCDCCDGSDEPRGTCADTCSGRRPRVKSKNAKSLYEGPASSGAYQDPRRRGDRDQKARDFSREVASRRQQEQAGPRILFGISTVPRHKADYLTKTLSALLEGLPDDEGHPLYHKVKVLVMNGSPGNHEAFYRLKFGWTMSKKTASEKAKHYFTFAENPGHCKDLTPDLPDPDDLNNPTDRPGRQVRKQTCDLISLLEHEPSSYSHFVFLEDDFVACENALPIVDYLLRKVSGMNPDFLSIRFSFGMNGILLGKDALADLKAYLQRGISRLPPDLLYQEWLQVKREEEGRAEYLYRDVLLEHIGEVSSFARRPDRRKWPGCFEPLANAWSLPQIEKFDVRACGHSDISPCPVPTDPLRWNTSLEAA